jgi:hypothetical protein
MLRVRYAAESQASKHGFRSECSVRGKMMATKGEARATHNEAMWATRGEARATRNAA